MPSYICQYAKSCPTFQGKEDTNGIFLPIFKNVFCNRGPKGWKNCERHMKMKAGQEKNVFGI